MASGLVYLNVNGKVVGPLPVAVVRGKLARGELRPGTRWSRDRARWQDLSLLAAEPEALPGGAGLNLAEIDAIQGVGLGERHAPPGGGIDLPPPIPNGVPVGRYVLLVSGGVFLAAGLVLGTLLLARPDLLGGAKNKVVAQAEGGTAAGNNPAPEEKDPAWGEGPAENPPAVKPVDQAALPGDNAGIRPVEKAPDKPREAAPGAGMLKPEDIVSKWESSVAVLQNATGTGSGFLVEPNLLATNWHVAGSIGDQVKVRFPSAVGIREKQFNGTVVRSDETRDLALVRLREIPGPLIVDLGDETSLQKGQDILMIGSPGLGDGKDLIENAVRRGNYSTTKDLPPFGKVLELGVAINPGNSGGPVFDMQGRVVGVAVAKGVKVEAVGFAVPVSALRQLIRNQKKGAD